MKRYPIHGEALMNFKHWTRFQGRPNSAVRSDGLRVTINPKGCIRLNLKAWEALGCPEAVELLFDKRRGVIGILKTETWAENAFPTKPESNGRGRRIFASPFCRHIELNARRTMLFNTAEVDDEGVLSLPLESLTAVTLESR